jgi:hypothetical protein
MGAADSRSLRYDSYAGMKEFVRRSTSIPFRRFLGDVRREFMQRFFVVLHGTMVPFVVMPCKRAVHLMLRAFLLQGLRLMYLLCVLLCR